MRIPFVKKDTLADAQALFDRLNAKLTETINAEAASDETIQRLWATNAPDAEIDKAEERHSAITSRRERLLDAVTAAEMKLDAEKKAAADVQDRKQRDKSIAQLRAEREKEIPEFKKQFDALCARGAELFGRVSLHTQEALPLLHFMQAAPADIDAQLAMVISGMEGLEGMIDCGDAPAAIRSADKPVVENRKQPAPATARQRSVRPFAFTVDGITRKVGKFTVVDLPIELAQRALDLGATVSVNDGNFQHYRAERPPTSLASCIPLDDATTKKKAEELDVDVAEVTPKAAPPVAVLPKPTHTPQPVHAEKILSSHIQRVDRGRPYTASIAATRSAVDE